MITLHKLNGEAFILNSRHIEIIESKPDTVITLTNDRKYIVQESAADIVEMIMNRRKEMLGKFISGGE